MNKHLCSISIGLILLLESSANARGFCPPADPFESLQVTQHQVHSVIEALQGAPPGRKVHDSLQDAIHAEEAKGRAVKRTISVKSHDQVLKFPLYATSTASFFRAAVINSDVDEKIEKDGWKSGFSRGEEGEALSPDTDLASRAIEYARVKGDGETFPKNSSVVGVIKDDPVRTASVVYHTGFDAHSEDPSKYIRLDEIELGPGARFPECAKIRMVNTTEAFKKAGKESRYSTENEYAVHLEIPKRCVVTTYRIRFQKVDDTYYSDSHGNTGGH